MKYLNIFKHRNYTVSHQLNDHTVFNDNNNIEVILFICEDILSINNIKIYIKIMIECKIFHGIIVYETKITPSCKKIIDRSDFEIEIFNKKEIDYDITQHKYYCPHSKVDDNLRKELIEKYGKSLPIILIDDPVVKLFNFKKNDIIRIRRKDNIIHYRIVV